MDPLAVDRLYAHVRTGAKFSLLSFYGLFGVLFCTFPPHLTSPHPSLHLCHLHLHSHRFFPISQLKIRGPGLITAVNQKPALTSLPWSEKSVRATLWKVHRPVWRYIVLSTLEQAKKKKDWRFTRQLHFAKLGAAYLQVRSLNKKKSSQASKTSPLAANVRITAIQYNSSSTVFSVQLCLFIWLKKEALQFGTEWATYWPQRIIKGIGGKK